MNIYKKNTPKFLNKIVNKNNAGKGLVLAAATATLVATGETDFDDPKLSILSPEGFAVGSTLTLKISEGRAGELVEAVWLRDDLEITGAAVNTMDFTGGEEISSYKITENDVGHQIKVKYTYVSDEKNAGTFDSDETFTHEVVSGQTASYGAPTGEVAIVGDIAVGQTLTASNNLVDRDGIPSDLEYIWKINGETVHTGDTYTVKAGDANDKLTLELTYIDGNKTTETVVSTEATVAANSGPVGEVSITGIVKVGQKLTVTHNITDADGLGTITYKWLRDGVVIKDVGGNDITGDEYTLRKADFDGIITVVASYTDGANKAETVSSAATVAVTAPNSAPNGQVTISGNEVVGQVLTATNNITDEDGVGTISYAWHSDGEPIENATGDTYTVDLDDFGAVITVVASYLDNGMTNEMVTSAGTGTIVDANNIGVVTITGNTLVGETLTANLTDDEGFSGSSVSYQWFSTMGGAIQGATNSTYQIAPNDDTFRITVTATYTDKASNDEVVTSEETDSVTGGILPFARIVADEKIVIYDASGNLVFSNVDSLIVNNDLDDGGDLGVTSPVNELQTPEYSLGSDSDLLIV